MKFKGFQDISFTALQSSDQQLLNYCIEIQQGYKEHRSSILGLNMFKDLKYYIRELHKDFICLFLFYQWWVNSVFIFLGVAPSNV